MSNKMLAGHFDKIVTKSITITAEDNRHRQKFFYAFDKKSLFCIMKLYDDLY